MSSGLSFRSEASFCAAVVIAFAGQALGQWTQWGGPNRDFKSDVTGLADEWPADGPKMLWKRPLGDGYSSILVDNGVLFTMYRKDTTEYTIALRAADGATVWEHENPSPFTKTMTEFGPGPHATPLIVGERLYSVGTNGVLHCFDKASGKVHWKHDLIGEFNGELRARGYSCSPVAHKNLVILPLGSEKDGPGALALDQASGEVAWRGPTFRATYAAPLMIRFDGEDQLILFMSSELVGLNPEHGELLWSVSHQNQTYVNASTPVWDGKDVIFCANAYDGGARAIRLTRENGKTVPKELWYKTSMKLHHGNAILLDGAVYASSGMEAAFVMGIKLETGERIFRERGFGKTTAVYADRKLFLLDENGKLALATVDGGKLNIRSQCEVAEPHAWAAPTLAGATLYVRDRKHIMALNVGKP